MIIIKGIIMSGGMGTRLRPLTCHLPKPMVPIFNKPVMEYGIDLLKKHGIEDIGVTLFYLPDMIMDYFGDGSNFDSNIKYYIEDKPLGTGGSVKNAHDFLDSTIVVISGDAFTNIDLEKAYDFHREKGSKATLILKREPIPLEYGVVITDNDGQIIRFLEKPSWGEVFSDTINTGIYILEPEVFDYYEQGENFDFSKDLFPRLLKDNIPMYGYVTEEYWCDVGDLNTYIETHRDILSDKKKQYLLGNAKEGIWLGEGTIVEEGAKVYPPVYIGKNSIIKSGTIIEPYSIIGNNCSIGEGTSIKRSIIWDNANISNNCEIRKSVICNNVYINQRSRLFEDTVIGSYSKVLEGSTIKPKIKIWPYKTIDKNVVVTENLIWEEKRSKKLFGIRNISGQFNIDITPEIATSIGTAFASVMKDRGTYIISSDEHNLSKSIKNSIISGILSTGSYVVDIKNSTVPMCRFGVKHFKGDGGIHINTDPLNKDTVHIEFINRESGNIDKNTERKVENCLIIEDFKRCSGSEIKDVINIYNFSSIYLNEGKNQLKNIDKIKSKKPRIILTSPSKNMAILAENYLIDIGCQVKVAKYMDGMNIEDIKTRVLDENGDIGVFYHNNGEDIALTDGFSIVRDEKRYLLSLLIGLKSGEIEDAIIPYNFPRIMEVLTKKYKGNPIYSKSNMPDTIQKALDNNTFQYILNFDSIWAIGKIIDYLAGENITLNNVLTELPEYFYLKKEIPCKWDDKGSVIRRLTEDRKEGIELEEGVRFIDEEGWALIIPDEEKPAFNLYIEGNNEEYAEELWFKYDNKIKKLMGD